MTEMTQSMKTGVPPILTSPRCPVLKVLTITEDAAVALTILRPSAASARHSSAGTSGRLLF